MTMRLVTKIHIRRLDNGEIVHSIPCDKTGRLLDRVVEGIEAQMNVDEFYVDWSECD